MTILLQDMAAFILVVGGLFVAFLEMVQYRQCSYSYRWIYLVMALSGIMVAVLFAISLLRLFPGNSSYVPPLLGRPVFIVLLLSLILGAIHNRRITGGC